MTTPEPPSRRHTRETRECRAFLDAYPTRRRTARVIRAVAGALSLLVAFVAAAYVALTLPTWWPFALAVAAVAALVCGFVEAVTDWDLRIIDWKADWYSVRACWLAQRSAVLPDERGTDGIEAVKHDPANHVAALWVLAYIVTKVVGAVLFAGAVLVAAFVVPQSDGPALCIGLIATVLVAGGVEVWVWRRMGKAVDVMIDKAREKSREPVA